MKTMNASRSAQAVVAIGLCAIIAVVLPLTSRAEISRRVIRQTHSKVCQATAILRCYLETEDGRRSEREALVVLADENGLAITSIDYFPINVRAEDFKDLTMSVGAGDSRKEYPAELLGRDEEARVAILRVKSDRPLKLDYIRFATANLAVGDEVIVGAVADKALGYLRTCNVGRINAVLEKPTKMFSVTGGHLGVPGSPVFDESGRAVGIYIHYTTTRRGQVTQTVGGQTVQREGMVVVQQPVVLPSERFAALIKNPPRPGQERKWAWLGVTALQALTADLAQYYNLPKGGVVVGQVVRDSPAEKAGIKAEDVILKYGDTELKMDEDKIVEAFSQIIRRSEISKPLEVVLWRPSAKTRMTVIVTPEPRPKTAAEAKRYTNHLFGFTAGEIVVDDLLILRRSHLTGAIIRFVFPASWAAQAHLRVGDVVQKINEITVNSLEEFQSEFEKIEKEKPKEIFLQVLRGGRETVIIRIEPRWEAVERE